MKILEVVAIVNIKDKNIVGLTSYDDETKETPFYKLKGNEELITDLTNYYECIKPKWNNEKWIEGATQEEIDEYNKQQELNNQEQVPSELEIAQKRITQLENVIDEILMGGAE